MLALLLVFSTVTITSVPNPRPNGWVSDQAQILDAAAETELNALAERLYKAKGIELAIVAVDDVAGTPKQFATSLFNHWGIGNAQTNTGVLVLLVMSKRRLEIETGKGIEAALTSRWLADMQAKDMVPRFKQKDFAGGLAAGVAAIVAHLSEAPGESTSTAPPGEYRDNGTVTTPPTGTPTPDPLAKPVNTPTPQVITPPAEDQGSNAPLVGGGLGLVGVGGGAALLARSRRRKRICDKCNRKMLQLDEVEDDKHLEPGQQTEERIGSVDYDVLICRGCQFSRTIRRNKWFSGFSKCSQCSFKTLHSSSTTTVQATYDHGGQVEVTEDCRNCSYHTSYTRYTSQLTQSSSSDSSSSSSSSYSSGGSSFGGGSSSGGGAGSSW